MLNEGFQPYIMRLVALTVRRTAAALVLLIGGAIFAGTILGAIAASVYFTVESVRELVHGNAGEAAMLFFVVATAATIAFSAAGAVGNILIAAGLKLWGIASDSSPDHDLLDY